jgi:SAM-dependent methyltransferase
MMRIVSRSSEERALLLDAVKASAVDGAVSVLEAGCGQKWTLKPEGLNLHITGVDMDAEAMRIRQQEQGDLEAAIVGDIRDVDLPAGKFDVVYCSFVLEHVEGAEKVLDRLLAAVRPGGRLIVRVPDRDSVFGWAARHTPHRSHVWYKRYVEHFPDAGKPGHAPYPVVYDEVVSADGLQKWAARAGASVEQIYASNLVLVPFRRFAPIANAAILSVAWLSRGRLTGRWNNIGIVVIPRASGEVPAKDQA